MTATPPHTTAPKDTGFSAEQFDALAAAEARHFWFRARANLVIAMLRHYAPHFERFLDVGCGTGDMLHKMAMAFPTVTLTGSEISEAGVALARRRLTGIDIVRLDARDLPFDAHFDVVGAFDVVEHIADDRRVFRALYHALRPGGVLILTVPQHMWLWSPVDAYSGHQRRYTARNLHAKLAAAGFTVARSTSFMTILLPILALSRYSRRKQALDPAAELTLSAPINALFYLMMQIERIAITLGLDLGIGSSRLVVTRKP